MLFLFFAGSARNLIPAVRSGLNLVYVPEPPEGDGIEKLTDLQSDAWEGSIIQG